HTASLLGTARILSSLKGEWDGSVKLFFQPGEEMLPGGASLMIKDNVLVDPAPVAVIGQHGMPSMPVGTIGARKWKVMASLDAGSIRMRWRGDHRAKPE